MTAQEILDLARRELGTAEEPAGSNRVKYNDAYYGHPVAGAAYPWCCVFLWWLFQEGNAPELFFGGEKTASCNALASWAREKGKFTADSYRPGDLVFFRFSGKTIQHVGVLETVRADGALVTIEGNTGAGEDANGGKVQRRIRMQSLAAGAFRPDYGEEEPLTQQQFNAMMSQYLEDRAAQEPADFSAQARAWAEENGLMKGGADGKMQYKSYCTREQMAVFLYRLAQFLQK